MPENWRLMIINDIKSHNQFKMHRTGEKTVFNFVEVKNERTVLKEQKRVEERTGCFSCLAALFSRNKDCWLVFIYFYLFIYLFLLEINGRKETSAFPSWPCFYQNGTSRQHHQIQFLFKLEIMYWCYWTEERAIFSNLLQKKIWQSKNNWMKGLGAVQILRKHIFYNFRTPSPLVSKNNARIYSDADHGCSSHFSISVMILVFSFT